MFSIEIQAVVIDVVVGARWGRGSEAGAMAVPTSYISNESWEGFVVGAWEFGFVFMGKVRHCFKEKLFFVNIQGRIYIYRSILWYVYWMIYVYSIAYTLNVFVTYLCRWIWTCMTKALQLKRALYLAWNSLGWRLRKQISW